MIHWLCVLPEYRRQGVGRLLVSQLESLAWQSGHRARSQRPGNPHTSWTAAVEFYQHLAIAKREAIRADDSSSPLRLLLIT